MTTQLPSNACDNCKGPVQIRRPSVSGKHWCQRSQCRAARQRFYYSIRASREAARAEGDTLQAMLLALVAALSSGMSRSECPRCFRVDGLEGWVHPTPGWTGVCAGLGTLGNIAELEPHFKAIWAADLPEHLR